MFVNWEFMGENAPSGLEVKGKLKGSYRDDCLVAAFPFIIHVIHARSCFNYIFPFVPLLQNLPAKP